MQAQQAMVTFSDVEHSLGDRLLKLAVEIDRVEGYSEPHALAIARLSEKLGALMGLHGTDLTALKFAALVHDIGERQTKRNYLLRPDALTWEETLDLWRHPILGEQAAAELRLPRHAQLLIRWHHESWNGLGYPDGLAGEAIPLGARILRAVDSYYALTSTRPQRGRFESADVEQIIADLAGIEFDPLVVKFLLTILVEERKSQESEVWAPASMAPPAPFVSLETPLVAPVPPAVPEEPAVLTAGEIEPSFPNSEDSETAVAPASEPEDALEVSPAPLPSTFESREPAAEPLSELLTELPPESPEVRQPVTLIAIPVAEHEVELVALTQGGPDALRTHVPAEVSNQDKFPVREAGEPAGNDPR